MRFWKVKPPVGAPRVGIGVASYLNEDRRRLPALLCLLHSFQAQSWPQWLCWVTHDGPCTLCERDREPLDQLLARDLRIAFTETGERRAKFGHPWRQETIDRIIAAGCEWVLLTNEDNYYVPSVLEWLLSEGTNARGYQIVYCDLVHSHKKWKPMTTRPKYKHIDLGALMVRADLAKKVKFDRFEFSADGDWINRLVAVCGPTAIRKVNATLMVHN